MNLDFITERDAHISDDGKYRYWLKAFWDKSLPIRIWIMLNPSTADATVNDPTFVNCVKFSRLWGDGGIVILNLFAFRSPYPKILIKSHVDGVDIIGPANGIAWKTWLTDDATHRDVIAAWGIVPKKVISRTFNALSPVEERDLYCLGITQGGSPKHPLARGKHRVPSDTRPILWRAKRAI